MKVPKCLNKISPQWAEKIRKAKKLQDLFTIENGLNLNDQRYCIVGEARLFNDNYTQGGFGFCKKCNDLCNAFAHNASSNPMTFPNNKKLDGLSYSKLIEMFCKHMRLKHKKDIRTTSAQNGCKENQT